MDTASPRGFRAWGWPMSTHPTDEPKTLGVQFFFDNFLDLVFKVKFAYLGPEHPPTYLFPNHAPLIAAVALPTNDTHSPCYSLSRRATLRACTAMVCALQCVTCAVVNGVDISARA